MLAGAQDQAAQDKVEVPRILLPPPQNANFSMFGQIGFGSAYHLPIFQNPAIPSLLPLKSEAVNTSNVLNNVEHDDPPAGDVEHPPPTSEDDCEETDSSATDDFGDMDVKDLLRDTISTLSSPGHPAVSGKAPFLYQHLKIEIDGVGRLAFPLCKEQAEKLKNVCHAAPFGLGADTVVDLTVRNTLQLDPSQVKLGQGWMCAIQRLVRDEIIPSLGLQSANGASTTDVVAKLHKFLFYETGGFFKTHRDSEKEPGMFGTLVVQLPAEYTGGTLSVSHRDKKYRFSFEHDSADNISYAAFYADLEHEVTPVTSGHRLCLVYNLVRSSLEPTQAPEAAIQSAERLITFTKTWERALKHSVSETPKKIGIKLEHQYTMTNLSFSNLKGRDRVLANSLIAARDTQNRPLFKVHLALLEKTREEVPSYDEDYEDENNDIDCDVKTLKWVAPSNSTLEPFVENMDVGNDDILWETEDEKAVFDLANPDEKEFQGYTGNEGSTYTYRYYRTVLVIWPFSYTSTLAIRKGSIVNSMQILDRMVNDNDENVAEFLERLVVSKMPFALPCLAAKVIQVCRDLKDQKVASLLYTMFPFSESGYQALIGRGVMPDELLESFASLILTMGVEPFLLQLPRLLQYVRCRSLSSLKAWCQLSHKFSSQASHLGVTIATMAVNIVFGNWQMDLLNPDDLEFLFDAVSAHGEPCVPVLHDFISRMLFVSQYPTFSIPKCVFLLKSLIKLKYSLEVLTNVVAQIANRLSIFYGELEPLLQATELIVALKDENVSYIWIRGLISLSVPTANICRSQFLKLMISAEYSKEFAANCVAQLATCTNIFNGERQSLLDMTSTILSLKDNNVSALWVDGFLASPLTSSNTPTDIAFLQALINDNCPRDLLIKAISQFAPRLSGHPNLVVNATITIVKLKDEDLCSHWTESLFASSLVAINCLPLVAFLETSKDAGYPVDYIVTFINRFAGYLPQYSGSITPVLEATTTILNLRDGNTSNTWVQAYLSSSALPRCLVIDVEFLKKLVQMKCHIDPVIRTGTSIASQLSQYSGNVKPILDATAAMLEVNHDNLATIWVDSILSCSLIKRTNLLQALTRLPSLRTAIAQGPSSPYRKLAASRLSQISPTRPEFTWRFKNLPSNLNPQLRDFLSGPQEAFVFRPFSSVMEARTFASRVPTELATAIPVGSGKKSSVKVSKTRTIYDAALKRWEDEQKEATELKAILGEASNIEEASNSGENMGKVGAAQEASTNGSTFERPSQITTSEQNMDKVAAASETSTSDLTFKRSSNQTTTTKASTSKKPRFVIDLTGSD